MEPSTPKPSKQRRTSAARTAAASLSALVPPGALSVIHPAFAIALIFIEFGLCIAVVGTALYGSNTVSERAFRLLRWVANKPEPAAPTQKLAVEGHAPTQTAPSA